MIFTLYGAVVCPTLLLVIVTVAAPSAVADGMSAETTLVPSEGTGTTVSGRASYCMPPDMIFTETPPNSVDRGNVVGWHEGRELQIRHEKCGDASPRQAAVRQVLGGVARGIRSLGDHRLREGGGRDREYQKQHKQRPVHLFFSPTNIARERAFLNPSGGRLSNLRMYEGGPCLQTVAWNAQASKSRCVGPILTVPGRGTGAP